MKCYWIEYGLMRACLQTSLSQLLNDLCEGVDLVSEFMQFIIKDDRIAEMP